MGQIKYMLKKGKKCMTPDCQQSAVSRGICNKCYYKASTLISHNTKRKFSWEYFESIGMCLPPLNRATLSDFLEELKKREKI